MILCRGWPASFNFATTVFLVEWLVIFFVHSSGKQLATDFIIDWCDVPPFRIWHTKHLWWVLVWLPNTEVRNSSWLWVDVWDILQKFARDPFHRRLYTTFVGESFRVLFRSRLSWFWLYFLRTEPLCLHLPFPKWWSLPRTHYSGLDGSEPHACVFEDFWSWRSWGQHHCDFLIFLRSRKFLSPLDCKAELCGSIFLALIPEHFCFWI